MVKETINKTKGQHVEWEKIFADDISYERLISKIYKELIQLNIFLKKAIEKWTGDLNRHFPKTNRWSTGT